MGRLGTSGFAASGPLFQALRPLTRNHPGTNLNQPETSPGPTRNQPGGTVPVPGCFRDDSGSGAGEPGII